MPKIIKDGIEYTGTVDSANKISYDDTKTQLGLSNLQNVVENLVSYKKSNNISAGSATQPVYTKNGVPTPTTFKLEKSVPSNAKFTDTTYSNFVKSGSGAKAGLVPAPSTTAGTTKYLREDGTWVVPPNTTYSNFVKSGSGAKAGLVPAPSTTAGTTKYLREDGTWVVPPNTTYATATSSANGLMSSTDKSKLDGVAAGANNYTLPTASSSTLGGVKTTSTVSSSSGYTACPIISGVPYYKDTNTTYATATSSANGLMSSTDKSKLDNIDTEANNYTLPTASSSTLGGVKTTSTVSSSSGYTACPIISGVPYYKDTNTTYATATSSANGLMSSTDKSKLDGVAAGANNYTLPTASSTLGGVKTTSTVSSSSGYTACPIISGVPYYKDTNTTYSVVTTSANGLMSSTDKSKLDGVAAGANNYTLPTASSTLGGVKTTSTVSSSSGYTACPIISGVPYYKDTNTTYSNFVKSGSGAKAGLVPAPSTTAGTTKYLREDGTWVVPPNTTYATATSSANGLMSSTDKSKLDNIDTEANNYTLPTASSTLGGVKTTSTVSSSSGYTACPIISGVPYYKDTNTTYATATSSANGLMSSTDKSKLDGVAAGANNYTLPTASSTLGGVKTTSTVSSSSGYTACPIISGVPYYKDTNTTYSNFVKSGSGAKAGLVPAPSTTAGTTKYLREDGTWVVPPNTKVPNALNISVSSGNGAITQLTYDGSSECSISVSDASHNHQEVVGSRSLKSYSTSTSDTAGRWTVDIANISELYDGLTIKIRLSTSYNSAYNTLNVNNLGEKLVWYKYNSRLTSHFGQYSELILTYRTSAGSYKYDSTTFTDGWIVGSSYYSDSNNALSDVYYRPYSGSNGVTKYKICCINGDGELEILSNGNTTANTKTPTTNGINLNKPFYYYNSTTTISAGSVVDVATLYKCVSFSTPAYTFNSSILDYCDIYLKGTIKSDGLFYLDTTSTTSWYIYVPYATGTDLTKYFEKQTTYVLLGWGYKTNYMQITDTHNIYEFDGEKLQIINIKDTFIGNLQGNADSATKSIKDGNDNIITSTYATLTNAVLKTGSAMSGSLILPKIIGNNNYDDNNIATNLEIYPSGIALSNIVLSSFLGTNVNFKNTHSDSGYDNISIDAAAITITSHNYSDDDFDIYGSRIELNSPNTYLTGNLYVGYGSDAERQIRFKSNDDTHNCYFYGGNKNSANGIGCWDAKNDSRVWSYDDTTSTITLAKLATTKGIAFVATGVNGLRVVPYSDKPAFFIRNDGDSTYFMLTDASTTDNSTASYNNLRPITINNTTGNVSFSNNITANCTINVSGSNKLIFSSYGGGWYMSDTSWIRAYQNKSIYTAGTIYTTGALKVSTSGQSIKGIFCGSTVITPNSSSCKLFTQDSISKMGGTGDASKTAVFISNGDGKNNTIHFEAATYLSTDTYWYATFPAKTTSAVRINYMIICWS